MSDQNNNKETRQGRKISIVYMVAGMSSRYGGGIKQLAEVGLNGETLIEVSLKHAISAGFNEIVFVVGEKTESLFRTSFGDEYRGTPVIYAKQSFNPEERDRPWGTTDALVSAKHVLHNPFVVCNGDDLYGEESLRIARKYVATLDDSVECITIGYELGKVMPKEGKINRGIFEIDEQCNVLSLTEVLDIDVKKIEERGLCSTSMCSMTLFGLNPSIIYLLEKRLEAFKQDHVDDRRVECLLPVELGHLIVEKSIRMRCIRTNCKWTGITNLGDEQEVQKILQDQHSLM
ncbi:NTP transferase domain-containing protein [Candidatus Uhrbacteria bacterium]|nr:NTP transferase domain-containing protein [Candidatus Uhrbacteria bacterium]